MEKTTAKTPSSASFQKSLALARRYPVIFFFPFRTASIDLFPGRINRIAIGPFARRSFGDRDDRANRSDDFESSETGYLLHPVPIASKLPAETIRLTLWR
jgi:hypothetical protein